MLVAPTSFVSRSMVKLVDEASLREGLLSPALSVVMRASVTDLCATPPGTTSPGEYR